MQVTGEPRISVLMPVYRPDVRYLRAAIESIRSQTFTDWELLVVEDGGPSDIAAVIDSHGDARIRHYARPSKTTLADALNDGLSRCRASLVARMDGDDVAAPDRLARQFSYLEDHPGVAVVGSGLTVIDGESRLVGHRRLPLAAGEVAAALRRYNCVAHPAVMFRRDVVREAGGYREQLAEDYDLWCRLVTQGERVENLPDELLMYRFHEDALKFNTVRDAIRATINTKLAHFAGALTLRDRLRILAERILLLLPPRLVVHLFRLIEYRGRF
jgi:glycosyltransferase involved in cell wall biosynthesis